jgi:hypothetical protein
MKFHSKEQLKETIHDIHDFIRNSGAGYGMTALKIFNVFYSLKLLDGQMESLGLGKKCNWSEIKKNSDNEDYFKKDLYSAINILRYHTIQQNSGLDPLHDKIKDIYDDIGDLLYEHSKIIQTEIKKKLEIIYESIGNSIDDTAKKEKQKEKDKYEFLYFVYHQIPLDLDSKFCIDLFNKVDELPMVKNTEENDEENDEESELAFDLKGKIYEYFIGRDSTAITDLGAYFTDRHVTNFCLELVKPEYLNNVVPSMIDPFAGSGGFTLQYVDYMNKKYKPDWTSNNNFMNVNHYDMSEDVVKIAGVEFYSLTGNFPKKNDNFRRTNTFKHEFIKQYKYIFANPPYGGDKGNKTPDMKKRELVIEYNKSIMESIVKTLGENIGIKNDKELTKFIKEFEKESTFKDKLLKGDKTTNGLIINDSISSVKDLEVAVLKQITPFCVKNNIDYDLNKDELYKYHLLKIQNIILKKQNENEVQEGLKQKVNYNNCSQFIQNYANKIINYNDNFEYIESRKALIIEIESKLKSEKDTTKINKLNAEKTLLEDEIKDGLKKQRIIKADDSDTGFNDKEACSLILLMALLEKDGVCCGVLKEGVFFDSKYSKLRCFLINNFNVTDVVSVDAKSFENTTTKTSIIVFKNNGKTKKIRFHDLEVIPNSKDVIKYDSNIGHIVKSLKGDINYEDEDGNLINGVGSKFICSATYNQLSEIKITYNKKNEPKFEMDYSLNYKNYKDYKVECPEGYELKKLGDEITYKKKANRPASFANENGKYNFYTSSDKIKKCDECDFNDDELKIIMGTGGVGSLFIDTKFTCSSDNFVITTNNIYNTLYIYDYIKNNWDIFVKKMFGGSTLGHINKERLNNLEIPFPIDINKLKPQLDKIYNLHQQISSNTNLIPQKEKEVMDLIKKLTDEGKNGVDYEEHKLGDVCEKLEKRGKHSTKDHIENGCFSLFSSSINEIYKLNTFDYPELCCIINSTNASGNAIVNIGVNFSVTNDTFVFKSINDIKTKYIQLYLSHNIQLVKEQFHGANHKHPTWNGLSSIKIKVLKEEVMKKYNIQKLFDEIDELKNNLESCKTNYQKELKSLFKDFKNDDEEEQHITEIMEQESENQTQPEQSIEKEQPHDDDIKDDEDDEDVELEIIGYKDVDYIVIDNVMYPYNHEDESYNKDEPFGTYSDGKVKKYKK